MKQKGIILKFKKSCAIIMTDTCEFYEIKRLPGMNAGEEIEFVPDDILPQRMKLNKKSGTLVACLLIFVLMSMVLFQTYVFNGQTYAYVSVDINPSIQMAVDADKNVMKVWGLNEDGKEIIRDVNLLKKPVEKAVEEIVSSAVEKHYIDYEKENFILIGAVPAIERVEAEDIGALSVRLKAVSQKALEHKKQKAEVEAIASVSRQYEKAKKKKMSIGKYILKQQVDSDMPSVLSVQDGEESDEKKSVKILYDDYRQEQQKKKSHQGKEKDVPRIIFPKEDTPKKGGSHEGDKQGEDQIPKKQQQKNTNDINQQKEKESKKLHQQGKIVGNNDLKKHKEVQDKVREEIPKKNKENENNKRR